MTAVIFDLDGTLVDLFELHLRGFQEVMEGDYGLDFQREDLEVHYGRTAADIARIFFEKHGVEGVDYGEFTRKRRQHVIDNMNSCRVLPGAEELLRALRKKGVRMAVATSNHPRTGRAIMGSCGLTDYFQAEVYRTDDLKSKPAPDIFLKAAEELKMKPGDCVVVEDSVYGIQAAKAAGMKSVAVATGTHTRDELLEEDPDAMFNTLEEVDADALLSL